MKFGQLIEYNNRIMKKFFTSHTENEAGRLVPELFLLSYYIHIHIHIVFILYYIVFILTD